MYFLAEDSYTRKLSTDVTGTVQHLHKLHCLAATQTICTSGHANISVTGDCPAHPAGLTPPDFQHKKRKYLNTSVAFS
jgi:hypothetical protein